MSWLRAFLWVVAVLVFGMTPAWAQGSAASVKPTDQQLARTGMKPSQKMAEEQQAPARNAVDGQDAGADDAAQQSGISANLATPGSEGPEEGEESEVNSTNAERESGTVKDSSTPKNDPSSRSFFAEHTTLLAILAGVAIVLALIGLTLWRLQQMELRAVQSALKRTGLPNPPESSDRDSQLQSLFARLVFGMEKMQERIDDLEHQIKALQAGADAAGATVAVVKSQPSDGWFGQEDKGDALDFKRQEEKSAWPTGSAPAPPLAPLPRQRFDNDAAAVFALSNDPQFLLIKQEYNRTAQSGDKGQIAAFIIRHGPQEVSLAGEGTLVNGDDDLLWFVPLPKSDYGIVVPGGSPIREWHKSYRTLMGQQARERFGTLYEVLDGPDMLIEQPAWARIADGRYQVVKTGQLSGVLRGA